MTDERTPPQKIHALFYQALKPVAGRAFKVLDVGVRIADISDDPMYTKQITVDLSRTELAEPFKTQMLGLSDGIGNFKFDNNGVGTMRVSDLQFERLLEYPVTTLREDLSGALSWGPNEKIVDGLKAANAGRAGGKA